ncbi:bifunctional 5,10-methylene-tetrahydrofolate dehydrogenase/5,10-methylene-tetrahydrofolate cyclohydrolase [Halobacteriales archaeon QS_8_69_26]|nr:MAG: bifunctional 5,10-methylene-tetrahydrofolate dehydrogenase/5,10-methylene-tetrahydrofolate cyclohydrolase [Halobacteriales archaeon QS_8_69_26]
MTRILEGDPVATEIEAEVDRDLRDLSAAGVTPGVAVVSMSDAPADRRFVELKRSACEDRGIDPTVVDVDPEAPAADLYRAVERVGDDPSVHAVFVQVPVPDRVDLAAVRERIPPRKDVDCFHPENLGCLVSGRPFLPPVTTHAVQRLLAAYDVDPAGMDVAVVGRGAIGIQLSNALLADRAGGNATVTVCHSRTADLGAKTRAADLVVTACGVPELVDGSMLSAGAVVVDVSTNRVESAGGTETVGDVEFESAVEVASAITPVPGGVGPVTLASFLRNVVRAACRADLPGPRVDG